MTNSVNSDFGRLRAVQNAGKRHPWPDDAGQGTDEAVRIFNLQQSQHSYDDWTTGDLFELARVSRLQSMAVEETEKLDDEGLVILGGKNGNVPVENPRGRAISPLN